MSETTCHCQSVHSQIRRYQQCHEDGRPFILTKGDVKANIKFPINWNQRQCLCCFRETKNYDSYNNIIQMVMVTSIRLLQNINDQHKIISHRDDFPNASSWEDEDKKEADEAVWTMTELEHLLIFINNSLVMTFPLYIVCKHNHICTTEELSSQETTILASYCELTDPESLSVMLLRNVCFFCDSGGTLAIKKLFEEPCKRLGVSLLPHIVHCLANLRHWLTSGAIDTYISPIKASLVKYMCSMSDDDLRQAGSKGVTELVMSLIKENNSIKALFDRDYLNLSFKYFSCSTLKIRLAGLQQLNSQVALSSDALNMQDGEQLIAAGLLLAEWLVTNRIIEHIFGPNLHNELVKQSQLVLHFLGNEGKITVEHIDIMWVAALQKHCSRQVLEVLTLLVKHLTSSPLVHLADLLAALVPQQHTEQTLALLHSIYKRFWNMHTQEEKKGSKGLADTSAENEISVCSTDEESEDSTDSDDVVELQERPTRALPVDVILPNVPGAIDENPVQMVYNIPQRVTKPTIADCREMVTSSPAHLHVIAPAAIVISDSEVSPNKTADEHMDVSSDNEATSPSHPSLPVTVADLENVSVGGCKMVKTPPSSHNGSIKSVKNMADFDGEEFMSDDELAKIEELNQAKMGPHSPRSPHSPPPSPRWSGGRSVPFQEQLNISAAKYLDVPHITEKGHTILWDLIQEDTAPLLPEGLAAEAEKLLIMLLCIFDMSASIKLQFIQACISNIESYRSSTVSLRLLPKLITSFQQPYRGREVHTTTLYIEETFSMMTVFFNNIRLFREHLNSTSQVHSIYGVKTDINVRLQFLSFIYSYIASPEHFCLSKQQVDTIWDCLAMSADTSDHVLSWFNTQINSNEFHALSPDMYKYLYYVKLTQLDLKSMTMTGFNLFHHLHEMLSANASADDAEGHDKQLWDVALKSQSAEVSLAAIDYLNNCYMSDQDLSREPEFVERCMQCIMAAIGTLSTESETSMQVIDRGLYLLKNHMEGFRQQYAFQLRCCQLKGAGVVSHQPLAEEKSHQLLKLTLSSPIIRNSRSPNSPHKATIEVMSSMLLGELRAEITVWWSKLVRLQRQQEASADGKGDSGAASTSNDTHIRLITSGTELKPDMDRKSLQSLQFKDNQMVLVCTSRPKTRQDVLLHAVPHLIPMLILVQQPHFDNLFWMLDKLCNLQKVMPENSQNVHVVCGRARVLSRRVWELLMMVPTNPAILQSISKLSDQQSTQLDWSQLLDSGQPAKLIYALQVVESLSKGDRMHKPHLTIISDADIAVSPDLEQQQASRDNELVWSRKFVTDGGLLHLFELLISRKLEENKMEPWSDWDQEAFSYLLKLLGQFSILSMDKGDKASTPEESVQRAVSHGRRLPSNKSTVPRLNSIMMELIHTRFSDVFNIIHSVIYESVLPPTTASFPPWGRFEVLQQTMIFLIFWAYSDDKVLDSLHNSTNPTFHSWLKRLTLQAPEAQLRQEACKSLYKLCLGQPSKGSPYAVITLSALLELLPIAVSMDPLMIEANEPADSRKARLGASCQDYLWLTGQILESMDDESVKQFDLNGLTEKLRVYIAERQFHEQRHLSVEDEGLIGLLNLLTAVIKRNDTYKSSDAAKQLLSEVFDDLFLLPCIVRRHLPKCKSNTSRCSAYDLLVELVKSSPENYRFLHSKLVEQHDRTAAYPWDYWPMEDVRSASGFVGLQNLGATCYMATGMQHLYMIPQARQKLLSVNCNDIFTPYAETMREIQKMFAYLMESERKSYNPKDFCKVYEMDRQPLNTGEQKDMTEFFTDFITKLEDMSPDLKSFVKDLFGGVISNNVMSMECPHFSTRPEEFYTIRCQVVDMKTLYESLDELCVKDTLDGDNMYNCSQCSNKVRAEKRACFKRLPKMLCFNTMRYTFNMVTMQKEKINTHFSFPHKLDMAPYLESNLLKKDKVQTGKEEGASGLAGAGEEKETENTEYELVGVTVHTGTADGGHYYSFIKDKISTEPAKYNSWFLFNDSEVKAFDSSQLAQECFGGEMTSTTYDTISDKFMDFSFERTNSAYMLIYKRIDADEPSSSPRLEKEPVPEPRYQFELSEELADWIWKDNTAFLRDKNIFCHNYFGFMWQMCAYIPTTLPKSDLSVRVLPAQLSAMFLLETFIHAKEKPTMVQWIELLTKQFNQCHDACEWLLHKMSTDDHWSKQILIGCSNQMIRQMFQRLLMHVITQLRNRHFSRGQDGASWLASSEGGQQNVVARFICKQLQILQQPDIELSSCKYLSEYFSFLFEFARMGVEEKRFLRENECISIMVTFYVGEPVRRSSNSSQSGGSSDDEEEEVMSALVEERFKVTCLERMIHLVAILVESSRTDNQLDLNARDIDLLVGGRGMPFLINQIKDNINAKQTCNLIFSLCRWNEGLAVTIVELILANAIRSRSPLTSQTFLKVLTMIAELANCPPGHPPFTDLILNNFWKVCEKKPYQFLEWMSNLVNRNSTAHLFMLENLKVWVEKYLLVSSQSKVRTWAMFLLVSLVPSQAFKNFARAGQSDKFSSPDQNVRSQMGTEAVTVMRTIYTYLLDLMPSAKKFADITKYGVTQLVSYLSFLSLCLISKEEKLMFSPYFTHLWQMFQPKMTDPQVSVNQNKQALLLFWYHVCQDCPENIALITSNATVTRNIAFNYILADHDDGEVVAYNRVMLPPYYGILKLCCQRSRSFTRQLAQHQNLMWAFQHILPYPSQYPMAVDELLSIMQMFVTTHADSPMEEVQAINALKKKILAMYLHTLNSRTDWQTLITILKIVLVAEDDQFIWILMSGLTVLSEAFGSIHGMYHEATACHVLTDISDCLYLIKSLLSVTLDREEQSSEEHTIPLFDGTEKQVTLESVLKSWDKTFLLKNCITLLNSYSPTEIRLYCIDVLKKLTLLSPETVIKQIVPLLLDQHVTFQSVESPATQWCLEGPYYPTRATSRGAHSSNISVRPPQPQFGMLLRQSMVSGHKSQDAEYAHALNEFYNPYHLFVDFMVRVAVNKDCLSDDLVNLSSLVAYEGVPLNSCYFAKLWCEIYQAQKPNKDFVKRLCSSSHMIDYMESILHDHRTCLSNQHIYQFFRFYFKKVHTLVLCEDTTSEGVPITTSIVQSLHHIVLMANIPSPAHAMHSVINRANADLRALLLIYECTPPTEYDAYVIASLTDLKTLCVEYRKRLTAQMTELVAAQKAASAASRSAVEDNQKVPEMASLPERENQQVPSKRRKVSPHSSPNRDDPAIEEQTPKMTIEYRPAGAPANLASKGQSKAGVDKGKAPAKKAPRQQARVVLKSSSTQQSADAEGPQPAASNESSNQSSSGSADQRASEVDAHTVAAPHPPRHVDSLAATNEAIARVRKKTELTDHVLDNIGSVLAVMEFLETDDE